MTNQSPQPADSGQGAGDTLVLTPARFENVWPFAICAAFAVIGLWLIIEGERVGWFCFILFGAGAGFLGWRNVTREKWRLELGDAGFRVTNPFNEYLVGWAEVAEFGVWKHRGGERVAWRLGASADAVSALGRVVSPKWDGALASNYGRGAGDLAALMERWRVTRQKVASNSQSSGGA